MAKTAKCRIVCDYRKKERPYTAKDVGRIACYAIRAGEDPDDIRRELLRCMPEEPEEIECDCQRLKQTIKNAQLAAALAAALIALLFPLQALFRTAASRALVIGSRAKAGDGLRVMSQAEYDAIKAATNKLPKSHEYLQRAINELSLAEREAFAVAKPIIIK